MLRILAKLRAWGFYGDVMSYFHPGDDFSRGERLRGALEHVRSGMALQSNAAYQDSWELVHDYFKELEAKLMGIKKESGSGLVLMPFFGGPADGAWVMAQADTGNLIECGGDIYEVNCVKFIPGRDSFYFFAATKDALDGMTDLSIKARYKLEQGAVEHTLRN